ncbi:MAG: phosphohydrolase [Lachnospiraceae bacterium]|nr:phosphohydrolase [Lachnospiraceae bacterium]
MQFVESKNLKPGMRLAKPIYNKMGVMLYERDTLLTPAGIKSIENFGLIGIFILEPAEPLPPLSEEDIQFEQFQTIYMFRAKEIMDKLQQQREPETLSSLAENIISKYGSLDHKMNFTQNLRSSADFVYKHSISTAILAAMIANVMHCTPSDKINITTAALLYDLGYLFVPRTILDKSDVDMTEEDEKVIQECRKRGYTLLDPEGNKYGLNQEIFTIIHQVHVSLSTKRVDDLKTKKFSRAAKILIVADMFDQLTAMSLNQAPISEVSTIRYLRQYPERYSSNVVSALSHCIHILPVGSSIDLSTGDKGIVLMENSQNFLAPVVLNIRDNHIYDLSNPIVAAKVQIIDIMKTMDNRIVIDETTLKQFSSDTKIKTTLNKYKEKEARTKSRK